MTSSDITTATGDDATGSAPDDARVPVDQLSFEQAQAELEHIVEQLEDQHTGLDAALDLWERGEALHAWCQRRLDHAAERMHKIQLSADEIADAAGDAAGTDFEPAPAAEPAADAEPPADAASTLAAPSDADADADTGAQSMF